MDYTIFDIVQTELSIVRRKISFGDLSEFELSRLTYVRDLLTDELRRLEEEGRQDEEQALASAF